LSTSPPPVSPKTGSLPITNKIRGSIFNADHPQNGVNIPRRFTELVLRSGTFETVRLRGVFGAVADAGPDYWGRRIIQKRSGIAGPSEIDYLLLSPDDRAGAIGFGRNQSPPAPKAVFNRTVQLEALQAAADAIVADEDMPAGTADAAHQVDDLLLLDTAMGGARPKTVIEDAGALWVAKFNRTDDRINNARVERAMLELGRNAGLVVADSRIVSVGGRDVLLVKRFDRQQQDGAWRRARMVSGFTLLQADETPDSRERWSYVLLAEQLRRISANPKEDARELFRRMCFNAMISNLDDHPRNHAVIAWERGWGLSPAYDLTPQVPISIEHRDLAMSCGDYGRFANARNMLSQARRFTLDRQEAWEIIEGMEMLVSNHWYAKAREEGVSERDCERIRGAFMYPGFGRAPVEEDMRAGKRII
ncbi:MAG: HipA domain-containing protein, partial [Alphaproteobacteria bacterium]|nr:HipA domain-containing protein [Alphaproteobacteria bacterium]